MIKNMENPQRKEKRQQPQPQPRPPISIGGGGINGAVLAWGGAMAVAGLIAAFAIKRRSKSGAKKKEEQVKKTENVEEKQGGEGEADGEEEEEEGRLGLNDPLSQNQCCTTNHETAKMDVTQTKTKTQIDSSYMASAINSTLEEKAKPKDSLRERPTNLPQQIVPLINYSIPSHQEEIIPFSSLKPAIQEIIPFNKLKPEFIAGILEEFKSPVIDIVDPPLPLKEAKGPVVERLIVKPLIHQVTLDEEALLSPIIEADEDNNEEDEDEFDVEVEVEEDESVDEGEEALVAADESSSVCNDEAIWPAEAIEELAQELKGMKIDFDRPREEDAEADNGTGIAKEHPIMEAKKPSENRIGIAKEHPIMEARKMSESFSEDDDGENDGNGNDSYDDEYNISETNSNVEMENQEEELVPLNNNQQEVVATAVAQTAKLSRSRSSTWMWSYMFVMFLLVLLLFRFDAMSCYLLNQ